MSILLKLPILPVFFIVTSIFALNYNGFALFHKNVKFSKLTPSEQAEIESLARKTIWKMFDLDLETPAKISLHRMENVEENVFTEPFLTGNSRQIHGYHYTDESLTDLCSGIVTRSTQLNWQYRNRRISVTFDCNRWTIMPPARTTVKTVLLFIAVAVVINVLQLFRCKPESHSQSAPIEEEVVSEVGKIFNIGDDESMLIEDFENDIHREATFHEKVENWDNSGLESAVEDV